MNTSISITVLIKERPNRDQQTRAILDLIACTPREAVLYFKVKHNPVFTEDGYTHFPNLRALSFNCVALATAFPTPNPDRDGKILPSLEHVLLEDMCVDGDDGWKPLTTFLACRMSTGNRLGTLVIADYEFTTPQEVEKEIRSMVRELEFDRLDIEFDL